MDSTDLINQAIQGDRDAFIRLIREIENSLYNTAKSMLRKEEDVADAIQETILKAYKSMHTLREPSISEPGCSASLLMNVIPC